MGVALSCRSDGSNGAHHSLALQELAEQEEHLIERHAFVCMTGADRDSLPLTLLALLTHYEVPLVPKPFDIDGMLAVIGQAELRLAQVPTFTRLTPKLQR